MTADREVLRPPTKDATAAEATPGRGPDEAGPRSAEPLPVSGRAPSVDYRNAGGIARILKNGLCHRCGACVGFCPSGTLGLDGDGAPQRVAACTECNLCVRYCSGAATDYAAFQRAMFGPECRPDPALGVHRSVLVAHSADETIRWAGTSGGVVTRLLVDLLDTGRIRGALVAIQDPDDPTRGRGIVAQTRGEIVAAAGSRYTTTPSLSALREIASEEGPFAAVGLPCQVHALRMAQMSDPDWRARIPYVIGLYCHFNPPATATREVSAALAPGKTLKTMDYRHKGNRGWPQGSLRATYADGSTWSSPHGPSESVTVLGMLFPLGRCTLCTDATAEFSDVSVGDPWIRAETGEWKYNRPGGWSSVIVRSQTGEDLIRDAVSRDVLVAASIAAEDIIDGQQPMIREKKRDVAFRLAVRRAVGLPVPTGGPEGPPLALGDILRGVRFILGRLIPACGPLRRVLVRFAFSPVGGALVDWRAGQKRRKAARRLSRGIRRRL